MPYDRFGRTPEMARRDRIQTWTTILALGLLLAGAATIAVLVMMVACA